MLQQQHNNSFNASAVSSHFIENLVVFALFTRPVNSSVRRLTVEKQTYYVALSLLLLQV